MEASSSTMEAGVREVDEEASSSEMQDGGRPGDGFPGPPGSLCRANGRKDNPHGQNRRTEARPPGRTKGSGRGSSAISSCNFSYITITSMLHFQSLARAAQPPDENPIMSATDKGVIADKYY